jgi:hypothetical protein
MTDIENKIGFENKHTRKVLYHIWFSKEVKISRMKKIKKKGRTNLFDEEKRNRKLTVTFETEKKQANGSIKEKELVMQ